LSLLDKNRKHYRTHQEDVPQVFDAGMAPTPESEKAEIAAWTSVARAILNLSETNTRN
jgi:hypothetical protein